MDMSLATQEIIACISPFPTLQISALCPLRIQPGAHGYASPWDEAATCLSPPGQETCWAGPSSKHFQYSNAQQHLSCSPQACNIEKSAAADPVQASSKRCPKESGYVHAKRLKTCAVCIPRHKVKLAGSLPALEVGAFRTHAPQHSNCAVPLMCPEKGSFTNDRYPYRATLSGSTSFWWSTATIAQEMIPDGAATREELQTNMDP